MILTITTSVLYGQKKTIDLLKGNVGPYDCTYSKVINMDKGDTIFYLYMGFKNAKYKAITDLQSLFFKDQTALDKFIADLKSALIEMDNKTSQVSWTGKEYSIDKYDFSQALYISDEKGAYPTLTKKQVEKLIAWLERFKIGTDEIKPDTNSSDSKKQGSDD